MRKTTQINDSRARQEDVEFMHQLFEILEDSKRRGATGTVEATLEAIKVYKDRIAHHDYTLEDDYYRRFPDPTPEPPQKKQNSRG